MKRRDLIQRLNQCGARFVREGGSHSIYQSARTNAALVVPRHVEVSPGVSRKLLQEGCGVARDRRSQRDWYPDWVYRHRAYRNRDHELRVLIEQTYRDETEVDRMFGSHRPETPEARAFIRDRYMARIAPIQEARARLKQELEALRRKGHARRDIVVRNERRARAKAHAHERGQPSGRAAPSSGSRARSRLIPRLHVGKSFRRPVGQTGDWQEVWLEKLPTTRAQFIDYIPFGAKSRLMAVFQSGRFNYAQPAPSRSGRDPARRARARARDGRRARAEAHGHERAQPSGRGVPSPSGPRGQRGKPKRRSTPTGWRADLYGRYLGDGRYSYDNAKQARLFVQAVRGEGYEAYAAGHVASSRAPQDAIVWADAFVTKYG